MKKFGLFLLAVVMVAGMAGCGGGGDDMDCGDVGKNACEKLYDCGYVFVYGGSVTSEDFCGATVGSILTGSYSDEYCRDEWENGKDLSCADYLTWFNLN